MLALSAMESSPHTSHPTDTPRVFVVKSGELKIVPEMHKETWYKWLGNIRHWCISRQLWWGHRIPAYLINKNGAPPANSSNPDNWVVLMPVELA